MNVLLQVGWTWYPSVVIGFGVWTISYILTIRHGSPTPLVCQIAFHFGTFVGLLALVSPLDKLGDEYLFSAHMLQHLLLIFITAPLWLVGTPGWLIDRIIPQQRKPWVIRLASPISTFVVFVSVLWFWHIPFIYEMAQESEAVHALEHLSFIGAALVGWWPVAGPETSEIIKPQPPVRILYLFLLAIPCTSLAAVLTFAHTPMYSFYVTAPHIFGLNALQDQHLGGLLMWLPTHMILLLALGITFINWFKASEHSPELDLVDSRP